MAYGNNCYYFGEELYTWQDSEEACGNISSTVDFVTITNMYEQVRSALLLLFLKTYIK